MTELQRLELRASAMRADLNELALRDDLSDDERETMETRSAEYADLDRRIAIVRATEGDREAEATDDEPETRERADLLETADMGAIFAAVLAQRSTDGAEREVQSEYGLADNQVPLAMLETRAVTPAPAAGSRTANQAPIIPYVFPDSAAAFLSVPQPTVPVGDRVYTVLTTPASPGTPAKDAAQDETTGAFTAKVLSPARIQAAFFYNREDAAVFAGMDAALRQNLRDAMADKLDSLVVAGLIAGGQAVDKTGQSKPPGFANYISNLYENVDGRYASGTGALRIAVGSDVYGLMGGSYRGTGTNETALDVMQRVTGGVRVSAHVPAIASKKVKTIYRRGTRMDAVTPIWEGITLIPDEITGASQGRIRITAVMLYAFAVIRAANFRIYEYQNAA